MGQIPADSREQLGIAQGGFRAGSADVIWGADGAVVEDGNVTLFIVAEHWNAEGLVARCQARQPLRGALITTNKSIRDWTELLAGDEVLAAAILDRLLHRAHVLNIKGRSYRLRDLEDALKLAHA